MAAPAHQRQLLVQVCGLADRDTNPYRCTGNVSLRGNGLIRGRESDTMGVGNAAITPWFHLTADLQVVDNQNVADNTATILGLRAKIDL